MAKGKVQNRLSSLAPGLLQANKAEWARSLIFASEGVNLRNKGRVESKVSERKSETTASKEMWINATWGRI